MSENPTNSKLEAFLKKYDDLASRYQLIKAKAIEIIKWMPPPDPDVKELPPYYSDHGVDHSKRILSILDRLTEKVDLASFEVFPILCSVWLHDVGMFVDRESGEAYEMTRSQHHLRSVNFIKKEAESGRLPIDQWQLPNILDICRAHRSKVQIEEIPKRRPSEDGSGDIRVRLLASLFRIADACDVHYSRAPETVFKIHEEFIPLISKDHWRKHFRMAHVRFNWDKSCIDVPINFPEGDLEQTEQLRLAGSIKTELTAELRSVEKCFEEYGIKLFHADIIDYAKGEYVDLSHFEEKNGLGWALSSFAKKSSSRALDVLLFQPILAQEEVDHCYVETDLIRDLIQEVENADFKNNYLFCSQPRTGKTSLLAYLSAKAITKGFNVYWFSRQMSVPKIDEFIYKLSFMGSLDEGTILVFDNIHEDEHILSLIHDLRKQKPNIVIWCATRITEFVNLRSKWSEINSGFIEKQVPGYLSTKSIKLFLNKYREMIDEEIERLILQKKNITAYYLVDIYRQLKGNSLSDVKLLPQDVVKQIALDIKEDNKKSYNALDEMERMALKIISFLKITSKTLLENLLKKIDSKKSVGVVDSLLKRQIVFSSIAVLPINRKDEIETVDIFDSFKEFVYQHLLEFEKKTLIPNLLISDASECIAEIPHSLLSLTNIYKKLNEDQRKQVKEIVFAKQNNFFILYVASNLAVKDKDYLQLATIAYDAAAEIDIAIVADFGGAFYQAKDHSQAIKFFTKALKVVPNDARWLHYLAHAYAGVNDLDSAVINMEKAASTDKKYLDCLGLIYQKLNRDNEAIECYKEALARDPVDAEAWNNLGVLYRKQNEYDKAKDCYDKALEIKPDFIWSIKGLAMYWQERSDYKKSEEYCLKAIKITDDDAHTWYLLGQAKYYLTDYNDAIKSFERCIQLNPGHCMPYSYLGDIYQKLNDDEKQIYYYNKTIEVHPDHVSAYFKIARVYIERRKYQIARDYFLKIIESDSNCESESYRLATRKLIFVNTMLKLEANCLTEEDKDALDGHVLNELSFELIEIGRYREAEEFLVMGIEKTPDFSYLYATKGLLYFKQGQLKQGLELYLHAISMSPDDIALKQKFNYEYGKALRIDGQANNALHELEIALHSSSEYVPKKEIEEEILKAKT